MAKEQLIYSLTQAPHFSLPLALYRTLGTLTFIYQPPGRLSLVSEDPGPSLSPSVLLNKNVLNE